MKEEEQKAVDMLNTFRLEHKFFNIRQADNLEDNIEIVLNVLEKLQKENEELKSEIEKRKYDNETLKNFASAIFNDDFENKYISKQEANEYKKEIEQLHEQIDKMNSFMNEKILKESEVSYENTEENQKKE